MTNQEMFEAIEGSYVPGLGKGIDKLLQACRLAMEKKPEDEITADLLKATLNLIDALKDGIEIQWDIASLSLEQREIFDRFMEMSDEQLREFGDVNPQHREFVAQLLFWKEEARRAKQKMEEARRTLLGENPDVSPAR